MLMMKLFPGAFQSGRQLLIVQHRENLQVHQISPHISEFKKLLRVVCLKKIESAAEISSRPSAEELDPFRRQATRILESRYTFSACFCVWAPIECSMNFMGFSYCISN